MRRFFRNPGWSWPQIVLAVSIGFTSGLYIWSPKDLKKVIADERTKRIEAAKEEKSQN